MSTNESLSLSYFEVCRFEVCRLMFSSNLKRKSQPLSLQVGFFCAFAVSSSGISIYVYVNTLEGVSQVSMLSLLFSFFLLSVVQTG